MCGIAGIVRWDRRPVLEHEIRDDVRRHGPPWTGRRRHLPGRRRRPRHAAAQHHRSGQRPPADFERRRIRLDRVQRRDLQLQAAAPICSNPGATSCGRRATPKPSCTCTRTSARDASSTCGACSRSRSGIPAQRTMLLARDRLGIKPLYYASANGELALRVGAEADPAAMTSPIDRSAGRPSDTCSRFSRPRQHQSIVEASPSWSPRAWRLPRRIMPPRIERYWDVAFEPDESASEDVLVERLRERLHDAVASHQVSDVPVGAFLSGGIDSSADRGDDGEACGRHG